MLRVLKVTQKCRLDWRNLAIFSHYLMLMSRGHFYIKSLNRINSAINKNPLARHTVCFSHNTHTDCSNLDSFDTIETPECSVVYFKHFPDDSMKREIENLVTSNDLRMISLNRFLNFFNCFLNCQKWFLRMRMKMVGELRHEPLEISSQYPIELISWEFAESNRMLIFYFFLFSPFSSRANMKRAAKITSIKFMVLRNRRIEVAWNSHRTPQNRLRASSGR